MGNTSCVHGNQDNKIRFVGYPNVFHQLLYNQNNPWFPLWLWCWTGKRQCISGGLCGMGLEIWMRWRVLKEIRAEGEGALLPLVYLWGTEAHDPQMHLHEISSCPMGRGVQFSCGCSRPQRTCSWHTPRGNLWSAGHRWQLGNCWLCLCPGARGKPGILDLHKHTDPKG